MPKGLHITAFEVFECSNVVVWILATLASWTANAELAVTVVIDEDVD